MFSWQSFRSFGARALMVSLASGVLLIAGCSKVTKGNYEKLKEGMTVAEVEGILGKGTVENSSSLLGSARKEEWKDGEKTITAVFAEDKMIGFESKGL